MKNLVKEITSLAHEITDNDWELTDFEVLQIAAKIQQNRIISEAFMVGIDGVPGALEAIAMELGANRDGLTIKEAIQNIADNLNKE
jgi:uncharacterized protein (DUF849 family)